MIFPLLSNTHGKHRGESGSQMTASSATQSTNPRTSD